MRGLDPEGLDSETGILLGLKVSLHVCQGKMISLRYQIILKYANCRGILYLSYDNREWRELRKRNSIRRRVDGTSTTGLGSRGGDSWTRFWRTFWRTFALPKKAKKSVLLSPFLISGGLTLALIVAGHFPFDILKNYVISKSVWRHWRHCELM